MNKKIILVEETIAKYQKIRDTEEGDDKIKEVRRTREKHINYPF